MQKIKVLLAFGTRPEAIKMAPVALQLSNDSRFDVKICNAGQHREILDHVLRLFQISTDFDLEVMRPMQDLAEVTSAVLIGMMPVLSSVRPDVLVVHSDTVTTLAAAIAGYFHKVPIAHVEAGLRTGNLHSPWPEEGNRKLTTALSALHFAPTALARDNLLREGVDERRIVVTGNTVIDALAWAIARIKSSPEQLRLLEDQFRFLQRYRKTILVTGHRRESFGEGFERICRALRRCAESFPEVGIVYPVHLNPNVREPVIRMLSDIGNVHLLEPLDYLPFVYLMQRSTLILTDSGGIQEEAPFLGKPVLVMRDVTERPEAIASGTARLVGTNVDSITASVAELLTDESLYRRMSTAGSPYGDGLASARIADALASINVR